MTDLNSNLSSKKKNYELGPRFKKVCTLENICMFLKANYVSSSYTEVVLIKSLKLRATEKVQMAEVHDWMCKPGPRFDFQYYLAATRSTSTEL